MWGAASILFWCARGSGMLVWARPAAATPAGAGGGGRWGARCAGPAASPPPRVAVPSRGGGGVPSAPAGRRAASVAPKLGGESGGGGGAPPTPAPWGVGLPSVVSGVPPGVYSRRGRCRAGVGVGRGPVGRRRVSAAGGGGGGRGKPPALVRTPSSPGRHLIRLLRLRRPGCRRPAAGRACGRLNWLWCARTPGAAASSGGLRGRRFFGLPPSALGPEWEGGGGVEGALCSPGAAF